MVKWLYSRIPISSKLGYWNIGTGSNFFYLLASSLTHLVILCVLVASFFVHDQGRPIYLGTALFVLLIFGLLCVGIGLGLGYILRPERLAYQQVTETCSRFVREISDPEILLDRIAHTLYTTLKPENLSVWRYHDEDSILTLLRIEGTMLIDDPAELPLDIAAEQLHGTRFVSTLPESALRQALLAMEVQVVVSLSLGDELIGFIGLGNVYGESGYNRKTLRWLDLMAGQLALIIKNTYLISDLEETVKKLQQAYRRTIDAEEEERRRLAIELHDDILSHLTSMAIMLHNSRRHLDTDPTQTRYCLEILAEEIQYLNCRLREITQGLYPSVLTDLGLIPALQAYIDSLARQPWPDSTPKTIALTAQGFNGNRIPKQKQESDLYYLTRQALDNALIHAQTEQVFIHLRWGQEAISVTVRDMGQGMKNTPEALMGQNGHLGLLSMNERALAWRGRLTIHTAPDQGTTVQARIPINQPTDAPSHLQAFTQYLTRPGTGYQ